MSDGYIQKFIYASNFTTIYNETLQDTTISFAAKGLLVYLLSLPEDWKIKRSHLSTVYTGEKRGSGREAVSAMFKELIEAEYVVYEMTHNERGAWQHNYYVYPLKRPVFQKMFPEQVKPFAVKGVAVNPPSNTKNIKYKEYRREKERITPPPNPKPEKEKTPSPEAKEVCNFLYDHLKNRNPDFMIKSKANWSKNAQNIVNQYNGKLELVKKVISWIFTSDSKRAEFWRGPIQSPEALYKSIDTIIIQINEEENKGKKTEKKSDDIVKFIEEFIAKWYVKFHNGCRVELVISQLGIPTAVKITKNYRDEFVKITDGGIRERLDQFKRENLL